MVLLAAAVQLVGVKQVLLGMVVVLVRELVVLVHELLHGLLGAVVWQLAAVEELLL